VTATATAVAMVAAETTAMVNGGGGVAVVATAVAGGHRAQSTVKSGSRKKGCRGGGRGDSNGVGNKQQSNKSGSQEKRWLFAMAAAMGTGLTMATTMIVGCHTR